MKFEITTLDGGEAGSVELDEAIFGLEPRADLLQRCVRWQLAKRQAGTHQTKQRGEIARTTKKLYKQKGTGNARHGAASPRSSAAAPAPTVRSPARTPTTCPRRSGRWRSATLSRPRSRAPS